MLQRQRFEKLLSSVMQCLEACCTSTNVAEEVRTMKTEKTVSSETTVV
jgi:hypothetical protein